jgi:hypothetical protein
MPAKSKHGKGKHPHQSRRSKAIQRQASSVVKQNAIDEAPVAAAGIDIPPVPKVRTESAKVKTMQYPFIVSELRRIGILAGIILVVLIILAIILS